MLEYRRTTDLSVVDLDWLNSELYALLALKTTDSALASIVSLEPKESLGGNDWRENREDIKINVYRFSPNQCLTRKECRRPPISNKRTIGGRAI